MFINIVVIKMPTMLIYMVKILFYLLFKNNFKIF